MLKHSSTNSNVLAKNLMNTSIGPTTTTREIESEHNRTMNASDKQELFRNSRSSSLPLKIMLNGGTNGRAKVETSSHLNNTYNNHNNVDFDDVKIIKSWNGNSSLLINKCIDKLNTNNGGSNIYLTLQNNKLSLSEHFLNLIREESAVTTNNLPINVSKSRLVTLNYNVNKNNESENLNVKNTISTSPLSSSKPINNHTSIHQQKKHDLFQEKSKNANNLKNLRKSNDLNENQDSNNNDLLGFFGGSETSEVNTETESLLSSSSTSSLKLDEYHENLTKENDLENDLDAKHAVERDDSSANKAHLIELVREESEEELKAFNYIDNNIISSNDSKSPSATCNENDETLTLQLSPTLQLAQENENKSEVEQENSEEATSSQKIVEEEENNEETPACEAITTSEEAANNEETSNIIDTSNLNASGSTGNSTSSSGIYSMSSNSSTSLTTTETSETSTSDAKFEDESSLTILEDSSKSKITNDDTDSDEAQLSSSPLSSASTSLYEDEIEYRKFLPKKSCLSSKSKFYIDLTGNDLLHGDDCASANSASSNEAATSSPLIPATPNNEITNSMSPSTSTISFQQQNISGSNSPTPSSKKKHVLFADSCGKELFTVRTMSEPSNCPPKLTSKIVQYFLNREFDGNKSPPGSVNGLSRTNSEEYNSFMPNGIVSSSTGGISSRNYDHYGISGFQYSNDSQLTGSIAFYSLNFAQPSSDYSKFRQRLNDNCVCLENVLLNSFKINGTIKVKNINYNKHVYVRCSFNNWASYEDYQTQYVSYDFYSSPNSSASGTSLFYGNHTSYQHEHKEFDTFRFEFQLPKTVNSNGNSNNSAANGDDATASIQFCICYRSGSGADVKEYWDSNDGKNYEILQYFIDIEKLKPTSSVNGSSSSTNNTNQNQLKSSNKTKPNYFKFDINNYVNRTNSSKYTNNFNGYNAQEIYY